VARAFLPSRKIHIQEGRGGRAIHHRLHLAADIAHRSHRRYDDRAGREHFTSVGVLLGHGKGILPRWNIDAQLTGKITGGLHGAVQADIFPFVPAGPHPVGTQGNIAQSVVRGNKHQVSQSLGNG